MTGEREGQKLRMKGRRWRRPASRGSTFVVGRRPDLVRPLVTRVVSGGSLEVGVDTQSLRYGVPTPKCPRPGWEERDGTPTDRTPSNATGTLGDKRHFTRVITVRLRTRDIPTCLCRTASVRDNDALGNST